MLNLLLSPKQKAPPRLDFRYQKTNQVERTLLPKKEQKTMGSLVIIIQVCAFSLKN